MLDDILDNVDIFGNNSVIRFEMQLFMLFSTFNCFVAKEGEAEEYLKRIKQRSFYNSKTLQTIILFFNIFCFVFGIFLKWDQTQCSER